MKEINYSGGIMIECRWGKIEGELPLAVQNLSGQWFK
jgi:hypothetical protein